MHAQSVKNKWNAHLNPVWFNLPVVIRDWTNDDDNAWKSYSLDSGLVVAYHGNVRICAYIAFAYNRMHDKRDSAHSHSLGQQTS